MLRQFAALVLKYYTIHSLSIDYTPIFGFCPRLDHSNFMAGFTSLSLLIIVLTLMWKSRHMLGNDTDDMIGKKELEECLDRCTGNHKIT